MNWQACLTCYIHAQAVLRHICAGLTITGRFDLEGRQGSLTSYINTHADLTWHRFKLAGRFDLLLADGYDLMCSLYIYAS